jgi:hypothetical protein
MGMGGMPPYRHAVDNRNLKTQINGARPPVIRVRQVGWRVPPRIA